MAGDGAVALVIGDDEDDVWAGASEIGCGQGRGEEGEKEEEVVLHGN
jgi:hypothetical protein